MPVIKVAPCGEAWIVTVDARALGRPYASGREAEAAAKALAAQLASVGRQCKLKIELRDRSLAAELTCLWGALGPAFRPETEARVPLGWS